MRVSTRCLRCSLFRGRYSNNKHFRTVLPRSFNRAPKSMAKHPEMSRPSRFGWYSKMAFSVSPVKRLQNLKLIFLSWLGIALTICIAVASSICLQYDRSSFWSALHIERPLARASLLRCCPFLMQMSYKEAKLLWHILTRDELEMKLYRELIAWGLILKDWKRRPSSAYGITFTHEVS